MFFCTKSTVLHTAINIKKGGYPFGIPSFSWAILGLNQGPPDYESVALTN